ncbi:DUF1540 domain-containing protein [Brevibacillus fluminis]|uniref:DUF1540 domain-containing protein n=1 Tax=Brevibacillus fluminis TaxID=511487 RepID=UPI003F8CCB5E
MPVVKCSVANCTYWGEGNNCNADSIMVEVDAHANANYKTEFASESGNTNHQDAAKNSAQTCCQTFKPKAK